MRKRQGLRFGCLLSLACLFSVFDAIPSDGITVDAGPDQSSTLPINSTMIAAVVSAGDYESSRWEVIGGNGSNVTIDSPNTLTTPVSFSGPGVYTLEISVTAGSKITDSLVITILEPSAILRPDIRIGTTSSVAAHSGDNIYNEEGDGQRLVLSTQKQKQMRFFFSIENDGTVPDQISLRGAGVARTRFRVNYLDTTDGEPRNITKQVLEDRYVKTYAPGEVRKFTATVSRRSNAARGLIRVNPRFKATSIDAPLDLRDVADAQLAFE